MHLHSLSFVLLTLLPAAAFAQPIAGFGPPPTYTATLNGANEVPPTVTPATGTAIATLNGNILTVTVTFTGLTTNPAAVFIHCCGPAGTNTPVAVPLPAFPAATAGTYTQSLDLSMAATYNVAFVTASGGTAALAEAALIAGLNAGQSYVNIHTVTFPGGEIRGQLALVPPVGVTVNAGVLSAYQINDLPAQVGGGIAGGNIDISNDGSLGADSFGPLSGTTGRICVNVYVFTADEQESECCSCLVTPNALVHLSSADLIGNPGNGVTPTLGIVVKLLATIPGTSATAPGTNAGPFTNSSCNAAFSFGAVNLAPGLVASATKFHTNTTTSPATTSLTETQFSAEPLSPGELAKLTNLCQFLAGNQSGAGLCKACSLGGLGADKH